MSKFSLETLQECVYPHVRTEDPEVIVGSSFGEDVALLKPEEEIVAAHVDPIVGAIANIGWLSVHVSCNDIAASGISPRWALLLVLVPSKEEKELLKQIMSDASRATQELGVSIIGGHTGYSAGISRPLVSVTALGEAPEEKPVSTGGAEVGDKVVVTKGVGLEGTAILATDFTEVAQDLGLGNPEIAEARDLIQEVSVVDEALQLTEIGARAMHDVTRGGLLETLLEISHLSDVGIKMDLSQVPQREIVDRFASAFGFDPLRMISSGTLVATIPSKNERDARAALEERNIPYGFIGEVTEGKGVKILEEDEVTHHTELEPDRDELARMWALHPRDSEG